MSSLPLALPAADAADTVDAPAIVRIKPLGPQWETLDPFLFCVHHDDAYPAANPRMGPDASLAGRAIGQDFSRKDGWSMYHGREIAGFPSHPHRGFETVTIVRKGLIDHADSLGATARFGSGDVQWLTAGSGVVHAEMFPLLDTGAPNPLELFQIWLNLPARSKMVPPHFTMLWNEQLPKRVARDAQGRTTDIVVVAGALAGSSDADISAATLAPRASVTPLAPSAPLLPLVPPPDSWAAQADADVAIWTIRMAPGAHWTLPPARSDATRRNLYFFAGGPIVVASQTVDAHGAIELRGSQAVDLINTGNDVAEFLLLQGRPIGEPVVQHGPFVTNTRAEITQTFEDYQRTQFGGWPWADNAPVHGRDPARFAVHPGGLEERP